MPDRFLAAVDMGTNSFHLIIVKVKKDGSFKIVDREREIIRLASHKGQGLSLITKEETAQAIRILSGFKELASFYGAGMRAVATSAVREAHNKAQFVKAVKEATGIKVEAVDGEEEAKLIFTGAKKALDLNNNRAFCMDIGGGSTEFILGNNGEPEFAESIKVGAVRLSKMFFPDYKITDEALNSCNEYVANEIHSNKNLNFNGRFNIAVGCSGTIEAAASMIYYIRHQRPKKSPNGFTFTAEELKEVTSNVFKAKTREDRLAIKGMEAKRADIIPAGLVILNKAFEIFKLRTLTISEYALREGIVLKMIEEEEEKLKNKN